MMVDGLANSVYEINVEPQEFDDISNPWGNAFVAKPTLLDLESKAQRVVNESTQRYWSITNSRSINPITKRPVAWNLYPRGGALLYARPGSWINKRAPFATKSLWVTPYNPAENYAAGDYPNQSPGGDGLAKWTKQDRHLDNTDIVLWHTFGVIHIPRPEDFPVMPVESTGFKLKPFGFFIENPAIDVPPSVKPGQCPHIASNKSNL